MTAKEALLNIAARALAKRDLEFCITQPNNLTNEFDNQTSQLVIGGARYHRRVREQLTK